MTALRMTDAEVVACAERMLRNTDVVCSGILFGARCDHPHIVPLRRICEEQSSGDYQVKDLNGEDWVPLSFGGGFFLDLRDKTVVVKDFSPHDGFTRDQCFVLSFETQSGRKDTHENQFVRKMGNSMTFSTWFGNVLVIKARLGKGDRLHAMPTSSGDVEPAIRVLLKADITYAYRRYNLVVPKFHNLPCLYSTMVNPDRSEFSMSIFPLDIELNILSHVSAFDVKSYCEAVNNPIAMEKVLPSRVREALKPFMSSIEEQKEFWNQIYTTDSALTGDVATQVLLPWTTPRHLTIAAPNTGNTAWPVFMELHGWSRVEPPIPAPLPPDHKHIVLPSDSFPDAAELPEDDEERRCGDPTGLDLIRWYKKSDKTICLLIASGNTAFEAVLSADWTSALVFMTESSIACLHPSLMQNQLSICRKDWPTELQFYEEIRRGFTVGLDARDFPANAVAIPCRSASFVIPDDLSKYQEHIWAHEWDLGRARRTLTESGFAWRNGFTCRDLSCVRH